MQELKDYYQILDISPFSSLEEIKKAYKKQMKIWHPDINHNQNAHEKSIEIQEAFQILINLEKRALYDNFYFNMYLKNKKSILESDSIENTQLNKIISEAQQQAIEFINKGYKHFLNFVNQSVSFIKYIGFIISVIYMTFFGIAIGIGIGYAPIKFILYEPDKISFNVLSILFLILLTSISSIIIYKSIKFGIYKLKNGPD